MCGSRAGGMVGLELHAASSPPHATTNDTGGAQAGRTEIREVIIEGILTVRDEFVRLRQHPPTHIGVPDSYRMDLVGSTVANMHIVWLDGHAHSAPICWREAGA